MKINKNALPYIQQCGPSVDLVKAYQARMAKMFPKAVFPKADPPTSDATPASKAPAKE